MSEVLSTDAATATTTSSPKPSVEVFAVYGVEPEIQAYAMAKYSRSALSMKESLREISTQKAEKFLNTFYFQYGHRSIADLAHIALAVERLSILAAIELADEQRWDGQERSTRYQDFKKSGYYTPDFGADDEGRKLYRETLDFLFAEYESLSAHMTQYLIDITPKPADMKQDAYERTLKARAFDITRYLLPLATNTSLGEIVNARTLETQVARLLSHTHKEIRMLGESLKKAATGAAYNVNAESLRDLVSQIRAVSPELGARAEQELLREVRVAPTLVKYADPNEYEMATRRELRQAGGGGATAAGDHRPGAAASRQARRDAAGIPRGAAVPLRHSDGYGRIPRHAPTPAVHPGDAGIHHAARLRDAARHGRCGCAGTV